MNDPTEMTLEEYLLSQKKRKPSKYQAKAVELDGLRFDSKAEATRYLELQVLERAHQIRDLKVHPVYVIWQRGKQKITYEADFSYIEGGRQVVEDVKGVLTAVYRLKKKMFLAEYPQIKFVEIH
jgi:hypothetical protein